MQPIKSARAGQALQRPLIHLPWVDALEKVEQVFEGAACASHLFHMAHRLQPDIANGAERIEHCCVLDLKISARAIYVWRRNLHPGPLGVLIKNGELVGIGNIEAHGGGEELDRMVGFQPTGLVGDHGIGGGVALIKAIAGELSDQLENHIGLGGWNGLFGGASDKARLLVVHLLLLLLPHGAPQQVGLAERIARQDLGDLHHLFLIDDDAVGLLQHRL